MGNPLIIDDEELREALLNYKKALLNENNADPEFIALAINETNCAFLRVQELIRIKNMKAKMAYME